MRTECERLREGLETTDFAVSCPVVSVDSIARVTLVDWTWILTMAVGWR